MTHGVINNPWAKLDKAAFVTLYRDNDRHFAIAEFFNEH